MIAEEQGVDREHDQFPVQIREPQHYDAPTLLRLIARHLQQRFPSRYWRRGNRLIELDEGGALWPVQPNDLLGPAAESTDFVRVTRGGHDSHRPPSRQQLQALCSSPALYGVPELRGVVRCPYVAPSGQLVIRPGYNEETGLWLVWDGDPVCPEGVGPEVLEDVLLSLTDFPWASTADRTHALGLMLLPLLRPLIDGPTPLHLISSTGGGAGKSYLADLAGIIATGESLAGLVLDDWGPEQRRQLDGYIATSPDWIHLDNLPTGGLIGGASLHRYLTAYGPVHVRPVGGRSQQVEVRAIWTATANLAELDEEQTRRTVPIRIERQIGRRYRRQDLAAWVRRKRTTVVSALACLVQSWLDAGRPGTQRTLAGYDSWAAVVGGVIEHWDREVGATSTWLLPEHRPQAPQPEWRELGEAWPQDALGPTWLPTRQVEELIDSYDLSHLQHEISAHSARGRQVRLGRLLLRAARRPGPLEVEGDVEVSVDTRAGARQREYRITVTPPPPGDGLAPWEAALVELGEVGVAVDAALWDEVVDDYRRQLDSDNDRERARDQRRTLEGYADNVALQARQDDGRVRASWGEGAWTGRISAKGPPLQAITKSGRLREAVVAPPGHALIVADWHSSHLRIAAGRSGDAALLKALEGDPHQASGDAAAPELPPPRRRMVGKTLNFAALNLCGPGKLVEILAEQGITLNEAAGRAWLDGWWGAYPQLRAWRDQVIAAAGTGWTTPIWHRQIQVPPSRRYPSAWVAGVLQSLEADALLTCLVEAPAILHGTGARVVLAVHDELVVEAPSTRAHDVAQRVERLMRRALGAVSGEAPIVVEADIRPSWAAQRAPP